METWLLRAMAQKYSLTQLSIAHPQGHLDTCSAEFRAACSCASVLPLQCAGPLIVARNGAPLERSCAPTCVCAAARYCGPSLHELTSLRRVAPQSTASLRHGHSHLRHRTCLHPRGTTDSRPQPSQRGLTQSSGTPCGPTGSHAPQPTAASPGRLGTLRPRNNPQPARSASTLRARAQPLVIHASFPLRLQGRGRPVVTHAQSGITSRTANGE